MGVLFFGRVLPVSLELEAEPQQRSASAAAVLSDDEEQLAGIAAQLDQVRAEHRLDDYGLLRLAIAAVDGLGIRALRGGRLLTVRGALARGEWNPLARMIAISALLRRLGYNAVPYQTSGSEGLLGIPMGDPLDQLDVTRQGLTRTTTQGREKTTDERSWTFWDGESPLGKGADRARPVLSPEAVFGGPAGTMRLLERRLPAWVRGRVSTQRIPVEGLSSGLTYRMYPHLADYLDLMPQQPFPLQARAAQAELAELKMGDSLTALGRAVPDEEERLSRLLQAFQRHFAYQIGPLRSLHVIFRDRHGDCDQLSVLMATALRYLGYSDADIRTMRWDGHLCLAVRPKGPAPRGAVTFKAPGGTFVALDSTYYVRRGGEPITRWGQLDDRWRRQRFKVGPISPV